ncbi:hypothetical protein BGAL_0024g00380 [Botrytis galanthina]|uniref:Uncharacterized protein n=1 Tax=Botrytis galanthina TaxID=278940 RepID=A0A4S8R909_9HELO|nr:hypothetical protein BGAL_0024g00380 [Botrytis galanthina]
MKAKISVGRNFERRQEGRKRREEISDDGNNNNNDDESIYLATLRSLDRISFWALRNDQVRKYVNCCQWIYPIQGLESIKAKKIGQNRLD